MNGLAFNGKLAEGIEHFTESAIGLQDSQVVVERGYAAGNGLQYSFQLTATLIDRGVGFRKLVCRGFELGPTILKIGRHVIERTHQLA